MDGHKEVEQPRLASAEKPNIFLLQMTSKVRQLSSSDIMKIFGNELSIKELKEVFPVDSTFETNGRIYAINYRWGEPHNSNILKAFVYQLDAAASRILPMADDEYSPVLFIAKSWVGTDYSKLIFSINVTSGTDFLYTIGERSVKCARILISDFAESLERGDYPAFFTKIRSSFIHEWIHSIRYALDQSCREDLSELGEFLYDPKTNNEGNCVFRRISGELAESKKLDGHQEGWSKAAKILLGEYMQLKEKDPDFSIPQSKEGQIELLKKLHEYYGKVSQEQRDGILKRYLLLPDGEIDKSVSRYGEELHLKF